MTNSDDQIRTKICPKCEICGTEGELLYQNLSDRLFGAPGKWTLKRCLNPDCMLVWPDPMPLEEDIGKAYSSYYTHRNKDKASNNFIRRIYQRMKDGYIVSKYNYHIQGTSFLDRLLGKLIYLYPLRRIDFDASVFYLPFLPAGRLLEVGCGSGEDLTRMANLGWNVEGHDFDLNAVRNAQANGLSVHHGDLNQQAYKSNSFDAIIISHVIEHVPDPLALLKECYRILRTGGQLVVLTPNVASWGHQLYGADWRGLEPPRHLYLFNPASLSALSWKAGFRKIECRAPARARNMFLASQSIRKNGKLDPVFMSKMSLRIWAEMMEILEWLSFAGLRGKGEEITLKCKK